MKNFKCQKCNKVFRDKPSRQRKFCSCLCYNKFKKGKSIHSEEWKRKQSEKMKGNNNYKKSGFIYTNKFKREKSIIAKKIGVGKWMKGKKHTEETKKKMSESGRGKHYYWLGRKLSEEHKRKLKIPHTEETKQKMSKIAKEKGFGKWMIDKKPNFKFRETSIELKIEAELQKRGINYQKQVPLCKIAIVDFYLPEYRIIIQCDGDYWHNRIGAKEKDENQDKVLTFNGFNVYRFWEHEINKSVEECIDKIPIYK